MLSIVQLSIKIQNIVAQLSHYILQQTPPIHLPNFNSIDKFTKLFELENQNQTLQITK